MSFHITALKELAGIIFAPFFLTLRICRSGLIGCKAAGPIIGLSPQRNAINDHTSLISQSVWIRRYGLLGVQWNYMGATIGLGQPPLCKLIIRTFGVCGYFIMAFILYLLAFSLAAYLTDHYLPLILVPYIMTSPYFKNNAVITGRLDFPGWPLMLMAMTFLYQGMMVPSLLASIFAALIHPTCFMVTLICIMIYGITEPFLISELFIYLAILFLSISFWYVPFFRAGKYTGLSKHGWNFKKLKDHTRTLSIIMKKIFAYLPFPICVVMSSSQNFALLALIPLVLMALTKHKERFINRFALEMVIITLGAFIVFQTPNIFLFLTFLFSIYFYASPSQRSDFQIKAMPLAQHHRDAITAIYRSLPSYSRILYVPYISDANDFRIFSKYSYLLLLPQLKGEYQEFMFGGCFSPQTFAASSPNHFYFNIEQVTSTYLQSELMNFGIGYVITFECPFRQKIERFGYRLIKQVSFPFIGDIPGTEFFLYQCPFRSHIIEPEVVTSRDPNKIMFIAPQEGHYHVKYFYYPAWRAFLCDQRLSIQYNQYGMYIYVPKEGRVTLRYRHTYCWERKYRAEFIDHRQILAQLCSDRSSFPNRQELAPV